jgi:hypothetical protein
MAAGLSQWWGEGCATQAQAVAALPPCRLLPTILGVSALTIHVAGVLSVWPAACFPAFAWLPVLGLVGCFLGLGIGCALPGRWRSTVAVCLPLLAVQALLLMLCRSLPFAGQVAAVSGIVFAVNVLLFLPLGHLSGRLILRLPRRRAYGLCLLGGLLGVAGSALLSLLWTPPNAVWALAWLGTVPLLTGRGRRPALAAVSVLLVALGLMVPPGGQGQSPDSGFLGLGPLSLGLYALALSCTERARRAEQTGQRSAAGLDQANRAA